MAKIAKVYDEYEQRARHYEDPETQLEELVSSYMAYALTVLRLLNLWLALMIQLIQSSTCGLLKIFKYIHPNKRVGRTHIPPHACCRHLHAS